MKDINELLKSAREAALEAGQAILNVYRLGQFSVDIKKDDSPLTRADKDSHRVIAKTLGKTHIPVLSEEGINIPYSDRKNWEYIWIIDPLDGTKEFINRLGEFTVNIALIRGNGAIAGVIYVPCTDILYYGSKETGVFKIDNGVQHLVPPSKERTQYRDIMRKEHVTIAASRSHLSAETAEFIKQFRNVHLISSGSSLKFMMILEGKADIYPRLGRTMEWDTAAAHALLNACNRGVYCTDLKTELVYNKADLANPDFIAF